jgi:uncharacterized protein (DUF433 family)
MMDDVIRKHIEIVEGASGPKARIIGHRVNVAHIVMYHEQWGMSPKEIADGLPAITLADVHAALAFYYDNPDLIAEQEAAEERFAEEFKRQHPDLVHDHRQHVRG